MSKEETSYNLTFRENGYTEEIPLAEKPKLVKRIRTEHRFCDK